MFMPLKRTIFAALILSVFSGCYSYRIVQNNVFSDEDGNLVQISYGKADKDHVNTFISPSNNKKMEFKSKLMVKVIVPEIKRVYKDRSVDGMKIERRIERLCKADSFIAWQCMNNLPVGTMYKTDDERWIVYVNGFTSALYLQTEEDDTRYLEVYKGVLCDTPGESRNIKMNDKTRTLPRQDKRFIGK